LPPPEPCTGGLVRSETSPGFYSPGHVNDDETRSAPALGGVVTPTGTKYPVGGVIAIASYAGESQE